MQLARAKPPKALISLVPMIDVMLILLVFFMVTSTYLNLDMIAMVETSDDAPSTAAPASNSSPLIIRLNSQGFAVVRGQPQTAQSLTELIQDKLAEDPLTSVVLLPSGNATTQGLVTIMDTATQAGATRLRLIRLEARP